MTTQLMQTFGWSGCEYCMQHSVQNSSFNRDTFLLVMIRHVKKIFVLSVSVASSIAKMHPILYS